MGNERLTASHWTRACTGAQRATNCWNRGEESNGPRLQGLSLSSREEQPFLNAGALAPTLSKKLYRQVLSSRCPFQIQAIIPFQKIDNQLREAVCQQQKRPRIQGLSEIIVREIY